MPGVPSGRGCEGCRKQKKKCNEAQPSCSRCARLHLKCVGSGQQRYKFKVQQFVMRRKEDDAVAAPALSIPVAGTTSLGQALIKTLAVSTDLRYNLAWSYGGFLQDIPPRLGINEALDSSVAALVGAHSNACLGQRATSETLSKYSHALRELRACIDDPVKATASETLCAVMILLTCQGLIGTNGSRWTGHCEGAARILKARGYYNQQDEFERKLLLSLREPVLFEGIFNNKIDLNPQEWETLVLNEFDGVGLEGEMLRALARVPTYMRRGRSMFQTEDDDGDLVLELRAQYRTMQVSVEKLLDRLVATPTPPASSVSVQDAEVRLHFFHQRMYGLGLIIVMIFNRVLTAVEVEENGLASEATAYSKKILKLAEEALRYRPLGSGYMVLCLSAAWIGSEDLFVKRCAEKWLAEYQITSAQTRPMMTGMTAALEQTSRTLLLLDLDDGSREG